MKLNDITSSAKRKVARIVSLLGDQTILAEQTVSGIEYMPCAYKTPSAPLPTAGDFRPFSSGDVWGDGVDSHAWFRFTVCVPEDWKGRGRIELYVCCSKDRYVPDNPQYILYENGVLRQGLDYFHKAVPISEDGGEYYLYAYTGMLVPCIKTIIELRLIDEPTERLYYDLATPLEALEVLPENDIRYIDTVNRLAAATDLLDLLSVPSPAFFASVKVASAYLQREFYGKAKPEDATVTCIGHTHIDCAWKWTLAQTREKVQRTFGTVLELMRRYPEYRFMSSQALLYQYIKEEAPAHYEQIKARVREGRWEVEGAMWVEADCNLASGESLVRQLVYGKEFFRREFGVESRFLWLPGVFGYSAALPQILQKCNVDWFLTSKIAWNDTNMMPYDTFSWRGIDGTEIPTYFLTAQNVTEKDPIKRYTTYVATTDPAMINGTWQRYQQKDLSNEVIVTYGWGDGGGGPTAEMLEKLRREKALPGIPSAQIGSATEFFARMDERVAAHPERLPRWQGELYLEFHRGTYTSQARNKKNNRQSEQLYQAAEGFSVLAETLLDLPYPKESLKAGWLSILTNQFHDIIPGSSIREVYEDSERDYADIRARGEDALQTALTAIADAVDTDKPYVVFNPTSFPFSGTVRIGDGYGYAAHIPAWGYAAIDGDGVPKCTLYADEERVETPFLLAEFDQNGLITRLYDKVAERELLTAPANRLEIYEDYPDTYDAWEISPYYNRKVSYIDGVESVLPFCDGVTAGLRIRRRHMSSTIEQTVRFYADTPRIDFETEIDWQERHQLMKVAFPVDINSDKATYEIQFGNTERPTHTNTSWDRAKFEVCAHKFADLSDGGYGISLLTDCKYGYDIHDGVMRLSLLRAPTFPDPEADLGHHSFRYAIYPHEGCFAEADTVREAYAFNMPPIAVARKAEEGCLPSELSLVCSDRDNVVIETVKKAESGQGFVVRLYDSGNRRTKARLTFGIPVRKAFLADMEENALSEIPVTNDTLSLSLHQFEIVTLLVFPA